MKYLLIVSLAVTITALLKEDGHQCRWQSCPYRGEKVFHPPDDIPYVQRMDSIHFSHPDLEDYQLEERAYKQPIYSDFSTHTSYELFGYKVTTPLIKIGCTEVRLEDIQKLLDEHTKYFS